MFGQKSVEIARLNAQIDADRPWIEIAKNLQESTNRFAADTPVDVAVNLAVQQASEEQRHGFLEAAFQQLDPERQLEVLVDAFGDGILKEALEAEREHRLALGDKTKMLGIIQQEANDHHRLRFGDIPVDSKVELYFYWPNILDKEITSRFDRWSRHIKGVMLGDQTLSVHNDQIRDISGWGMYRYEDFETIRLGLPNGDDQPPVYYGVGTRIFDTEAKKRHMDIDLGPVFIDDHEIFGVLPAGYTISKG